MYCTNAHALIEIIVPLDVPTLYLSRRKCAHIFSLFPNFSHNTTISLFTCYVEGCTLTPSTEHGVKFCDMEIVKKDLAERNIVVRRGMTEAHLRTKLELLLREEDEWQGMAMYRRDTRFADCSTDATHKLQLDRTILDMLPSTNLGSFVSCDTFSPIHGPCILALH